MQSGDEVMLRALEDRPSHPVRVRRPQFDVRHHRTRVRGRASRGTAQVILGDPAGRWRLTSSQSGGGAEGQVDVLVVDDEGSVRTSICEILRTVGITTGEATDGMDALQRLANLEVGAMILDVRMPRLDGLELLKRLNDPPPTVLVSAYNIDDDVRTGLGEKVLTYLRKPFRPEELLKAVASALGRNEP